MKKNIAIIFGGRSAEHEVSIVSARNIARAADKKKYDVTLVLIDQGGRWSEVSGPELMSEKPLKFKSAAKIDPIFKDKLFFFRTRNKLKRIDVVFPVLHGPFGEDGSIQGLFKIFDVPYVGPGVLGSAVGMDKDVAKRLLREAGILVADFLVFRKRDKNKISFRSVKNKLGLPVFIKPANLGSSVGISKAKDEKGLLEAVAFAFKYDNKIIIEKFIAGKEIECSVLGNDAPVVSVPGEIVPSHDFYSYEAKYLDENGARMAIPAQISKTIAKKIQALALKTFEALCCEGMGRVDFFLTAKNEIYVNEINTIPGFTSISMYPKLWEHSGLAYPDLIDRLIGLAVERNKTEKKLKVKR